MINVLNMVVVMTTCYRDKLQLLTEVHDENKNDVSFFSGNNCVAQKVSC